MSKGKKRQCLIKSVLESEISISSDIVVDDAWMKANIGDNRGWHPMREAQLGGMDFFDGEWARDYGPDRNYYWFWSKKKAALFVLFHGGISSLNDPYRSSVLTG